jgi:hypothetical protein
MAQQVNPTVTNFIDKVVNDYGLDPKQTIDMNDPLSKLVMAIVITNIEQGRDVYSYDQFIKGSAMSSGVAPDEFATLVNGVSMGFENFAAAGGFVSPAAPDVSQGGSSVPLNVSSYVQGGLNLSKLSGSFNPAVAAATQAITSVNLAGGLNLPNLAGTPLTNYFSGIFNTGSATSSGSVASATSAAAATDKPVALIFAGTNDWQGVSAKTISDNVQGIAQQLRDKGYEPVVVAPASNINNVGNNVAQEGAIAGAQAANIKYVVPTESQFSGDGYHLTNNAIVDIKAQAETLTGGKVVVTTGDSNSARAAVTLNLNGSYSTVGINSSKILTNVQNVPTAAPSATSGSTVSETAQTNQATVTASKDFARANGYTTETALSDGKTSYLNPTTQQVMILDNKTGALTSSSGSSIDINSAAPPNFGKYLQDAKFTNETLNADGSRTYTINPDPTGTVKDPNYNKDSGFIEVKKPDGSILMTQPRPPDTPSINNRVTISPNGQVSYFGSAKDLVQTPYTGAQIEYLKVTPITASNNPLFAAGLTTTDIATTAQALSIQLPPITNTGTTSFLAPNIVDTRFGLAGGTAALTATSNYNQTVGQVQQAVTAYERSNITQRDQLDGIDIQKNSLQQTNITLNEELKIFNNAATTFEQKIENVKLTAMDNKALEIGGLNAQIDSINNRLQTSTLLPNERNNLVNQKNALQDQLQTATNELKDIKNGNFTVPEDLQTALTNAQIMRAQTSQKIDDNDRRLDALDRDATTIKETITSNNQNIDGLNDSVKVSRDAISSAQQQAEQTATLNNKISDIDTQIKDTNAQITALSNATGIANRDFNLQQANATRDQLVRERDAAISERDSIGQVQGPPTASNSFVPPKGPNTNLVLEVNESAFSAQVESTKNGGAFTRYQNPDTGEVKYYYNGKETDTAGKPITESYQQITSTAQPSGSIQEAIDNSKDGKITTYQDENGTATYYKNGNQISAVTGEGINTTPAAATNETFKNASSTLDPGAFDKAIQNATATTSREEAVQKSSQDPEGLYSYDKGNGQAGVIGAGSEFKLASAPAGGSATAASASTPSAETSAAEAPTPAAEKAPTPDATKGAPSAVGGAAAPAASAAASMAAGC